ncbi:HrpA-like helicase [Encephalitozoon intestinalis ATCC 50506]|uniref:HrpA-like helicase n=1 Tax=Encephalitozoon intestinalis (strain ATCC 50506) TaxID=876142 RepID=E0S951_ENCIT|nr:HrpA-like helicase [Encephalitozoon intestinalis ATCC 50506]ADM12144.2 HrpA-like helicase [Encephalitozoon intestinalis ATCC 50506]UTX45945.1 pre-mRNA-splicing factor RNA helicase [Encephalitozoon intestinalis]
MGYSKYRDTKRWEMRKMKAAGLSVEETYSDEDNHLAPDLVYKESIDEFLGRKILDSTLKNRVEVEKPDTEIGKVAKRESVFLNMHPRSNTIPLIGEEISQEIPKKLPIESFRSDLMKFIREHQVTVLVGETGSGKSTLVPKYLYQEGYGEKGIIGCTQPRRAAAMNLASTLGSDMGSLVGYSIRFDNTVTRNTKIRYMTEGILLQELLGDKLLKKYSVVILDEAHERSTNLDISMGLLKCVLKERKDLKLVIMSATIEAQKFSNYFGCSVFNIEGRSFPVEIRYLSVNVDDYVEWAVKKILYIHENCDEGDILVFMTGKEDVEGVVGIVNHYAQNKRLSKEKEDGREMDLKALPFYSQLSEEAQSQVFLRERNVRRCIVSTNIAETSLTIPNIGYVVDTGLQKISIYNYDTGESLVKIPVSRAGADQRAGRAGRTRPGVCYRMYTASTYENDLLPSSVPEIQRTNIHDVILLLLKHGVQDIFGFDFLDSLSRELIHNALFLLYRLGAVCQKGLLTKSGEEMSELKLEPPLARMVINSINYGVVDEITSIVGMLSIYGLFDKDFDKSSSLYHQSCDFITLLNIFNEFISSKNRNEWCNKVKVNGDALKKAMEIKKAVLMTLKGRGIEISRARSLEQIQRCIVSSIYYNIAKRSNKGYVSLSNFRKCAIHPSSALKDNPCQYVLFYKHLSTRAEYMYCCSDISPQVILEEAGDYYRDRNEILGAQKYPAYKSLGCEVYGEENLEYDLLGSLSSRARILDKKEISLGGSLYDRFEKWTEPEEDKEETVELPRKIRKPRL